MTKEALTEAERKEALELAKKGELFDADGKKITIFDPWLRKPRPEAPPPKSDIAQALELVAKAVTDIQSSTKEAHANAIVAALQQNQDVLAAVRDALAVTPVARKMEEWRFVFSRNKDGISGATATQIN